MNPIETKKKFDLTTLRQPESVNLSTNSQAGVLSIISSKRNGKRIVLSEKIMTELDNPENVQFAFDSSTIAVAECLPDNDKSFNIKISGKKGIVYAANLVDEVAEELQLDFSDKTSITFYDAEYDNHEEWPVAIISVNSN